MELDEVGQEGVDWLLLPWGRDEWQAVVNTAMNFRVPQKTGNFLTSSVTVRFSRTVLQGRQNLTQNAQRR